MGNTRQSVLLETYAARQRAVDLLKNLQQAQGECEKHLEADKRQDVMKTLTGCSSIESAITSTKRMIEMMDRVLVEAESMVAVDEGVPPAAPATEEFRAEVVARIGPSLMVTRSAIRR
ncbi:MAG: hypothetical protein K2W85_02705 [Phycisphaerales bacterium]|nr:hypothetical protein [Phycisphaerales bacterium]